MLAAPFLFLQFYVCQRAGADNTSLGGLFDLVYMLGWMCSVAGLLRLQAAGTKTAGRAVLYVQLALLCVANVWNVWVIANPQANSTLFFVLDLFWPLSNLWLLVTGIVIAVKGQLKGWRRYVVLVAGLWLPVAMGSMALFGRTPASFYVGGLYSVVAWALLGWLIYATEPEADQRLRYAV